MTKFDIEEILEKLDGGSQYEAQLRRLRDEGKSVESIEQAVSGSVENTNTGVRSFVIYGEPQSGKTEMMICLTAKLLDLGCDFILHLLNDSVDLLSQNLGRFRESGLAPSAKNFVEILDPFVRIQGQRHVIFSKKNGNDLKKVINKVGSLKSIVIVDDEADYASPNSKVNSGERTVINQRISELLGKSGIYIGVTATPARLDLNNTFENDSSQWIDFPPHPLYTGQEVFFPIERTALDYQLTLLPDVHDDPKYAREAFFRFLVTVSYLNLYSNRNEQNYSMLIHTSGKKVDHKSDWQILNSTLDVMADQSSPKFRAYLERIWEISREKYPDADPNSLAAYVARNVSRTSVVVLNSERDRHNIAPATVPQSLFTIIIGGNIVSRGVTFENLLSMFFTRDVKHKIQQDTYIQRARMFGNRGEYLRHFELTIPERLLVDWHRCFVFHKLALDAIREGEGSPVWLSDNRIAAVAGSSIDKSTVDMNRGEMGFAPRAMDVGALERLADRSGSEYGKLDELGKLLGLAAFPNYLQRYIHNVKPFGDASLAVLGPTSIANYADGPDIDKQRIERRRGFFGNPQMERQRHPSAVHFLKVFYNADRTGRLFYKFSGSIQFIKNLKR